MNNWWLSERIIRLKQVFIMSMQIDGADNISDDTDFTNNADDNTHSESSLTDHRLRWWGYKLIHRFQKLWIVVSITHGENKELG